MHTFIHPRHTTGHRGLTPVAAAFKAHVEMLGCQVIDATSGAGKVKGEGVRLGCVYLYVDPTLSRGLPALLRRPRERTL